MSEQTEMSAEQIAMMALASQETARIAGAIGKQLVGENTVHAFSAVIGTAAYFMENVFTEQDQREAGAMFLISAAATAAAKAGMTQAAITEALNDGINDARAEVAAQQEASVQ